jgi:hypothetical protein
MRIVVDGPAGRRVDQKGLSDLTSVPGKTGNANTFGDHVYHNQKSGDLGLLLAGGYEDSDGFFMVNSPQSHEIERYREVGKVLVTVTCDLNPCSDISLAGLYSRMRITRAAAGTPVRRGSNDSSHRLPMPISGSSTIIWL